MSSPALLSDLGTRHRVALDATLWDEPTTGIGLYGRELHAALVRLGADVRRVGARRSGEHPRGRRAPEPWILGRLPALLGEIDARLFHGICNFNLPIARAPGRALVLTVHDIIPLLMPGVVAPFHRVKFRAWLHRSLSVADQVLCDSDCTRRDLLARFDVSPVKVRTVHLGADHVDRVPLPTAGLRAQLDRRLPDRFFLYAGALEPRKNVELVLDACEQLRRGGLEVPLVLAGQRWFETGRVERKIESLRAAGLDVRPLGYTDAAGFYEVIRRARALVFPSRYEGFGLPPLEAMRLGTPAIVSNAGSLPEVCGEAAPRVDPDDVAGLAEVLARLWRDDAEHERLRRAGRAHAEAFTWERCARQTLAAYEAALQRS